MRLVEHLLRAVDVFQGAAWDAALTLQELWTFGGRRWWLPLHWHAARAYLSDPPARVMLREAPLLPLPDGQYVYGETPALSMLAMVRRIHLEDGDVLADLGCGRGLAAMAVALDLGVPVIGFEALPTLVARARSISSHLEFKHAPRWIQADFLEAGWERASVFYIASTTFHPEVMRSLHQRLSEHETVNGRPLRVITLSEALGPPFRLLARQRFPMTWGWNTVYFHVRDDSAPHPHPKEDTTLLPPPHEPEYLRTAGSPMPFVPPRAPQELPHLPLPGAPMPASKLPPPLHHGPDGEGPPPAGAAGPPPSTEGVLPPLPPPPQVKADAPPSSQTPNILAEGEV